MDVEPSDEDIASQQANIKQMLEQLPPEPHMEEHRDDLKRALDELEQASGKAKQAQHASRLASQSLSSAKRQAAELQERAQSKCARMWEDNLQREAEIAKTAVAGAEDFSKNLREEMAAHERALVADAATAAAKDAAASDGSLP